MFISPKYSNSSHLVQAGVALGLPCLVSSVWEKLASSKRDPERIFVVLCVVCCVQCGRQWSEVKETQCVCVLCAVLCCVVLCLVLCVVLCIVMCVMLCVVLCIVCSVGGSGQQSKRSSVHWNQIEITSLT